MSRILDAITSPADLRELSLDELHQVACEIRELIQEVIAKNGGHLSSNLGVVELTIALHRVYDFSEDKLIWDVGHQSYTHKILTGRKDAFPSIRTYGGLSGYPNKEESPYDSFTTGHSGAAISEALGIVVADRMQGVERNVVAVVGDGALSAGMTFEALNNAGEKGRGLLVILNDNEMSISRTVGGVSRYLAKLRIAPSYHSFKKDVKDMLMSIPIVGEPLEKMLEYIKDALRHSLVRGQMFEELGFRYFGPIDGHNIDQMLTALSEAKLLQQESPVVLHVVTTKGSGFTPACENPTMYHSAKPFTISNGKVIECDDGCKRTTYTKVFAETLIECAKDDSTIAALTAAMPDGTGLARFGKEFPDRFFDVGICEQHCVGFAGSLAAYGLKPVCAIYSTFLQRAYDQVFHDVCLQNVSVVFGVDRAGIVGSDGPTHQGLYDIAFLRNLPNIVLMAPKDGRELEAMLTWAIANKGVHAIRYPRAAIPDAGEAAFAKIKLGKAELLRKGADVCLFAYGAMVAAASAAADMLEKDGRSVTVVNARFAKPVDAKMLRQMAAGHKHIVTLEDHSVIGGFGSAVLETLAQNDLTKKATVHCLGVPDEFIEHGPREVILDKLGLSGKKIAGFVKRILRTK